MGDLIELVFEALHDKQVVNISREIIKDSLIFKEVIKELEKLSDTAGCADIPIGTIQLCDWVSLRRVEFLFRRRRDKGFGKTGNVPSSVFKRSCDSSWYHKLLCRS